MATKKRKFPARRRRVAARKPKSYSAAPRRRAAAPAAKRRSVRKNPRGMLDQVGVKLGAAAAGGGVGGFLVDAKPRWLNQVPNSVLAAAAALALGKFGVKRADRRQMIYAAGLGMLVSPLVKAVQDPAGLGGMFGVQSSVSALTTARPSSLPSPNYSNLGASALAVATGARPA